MRNGDDKRTSFKGWGWDGMETLRTSGKLWVESTVGDSLGKDRSRSGTVSVCVWGVWYVWCYTRSSRRNLRPGVNGTRLTGISSGRWETSV